ncbi:decapping and exoribonuclease protein-like, partial [Homarus americanus]|uniref:decapping and exoribonuclease protein-like n=1 Tax=Homarus americanus TaxID=6706 RepID=UPI001C43BC6D
ECKYYNQSFYYMYLDYYRSYGKTCCYSGNNTEFPQVSLDLNKGIDKACRYIGNSEESFHNLLKWILNNKDCLMNKTEPQRLDVDFISLRRPLTTIMRSPYNFNESWVIYAVEFMGSIYFLKEKGDNFLVHQNQATFRNCFEVWGHKFEDYMCGGDPEGGIQANEEYRCVLKVMMDQTTMVFAPEVDCADPYLYEEGFKDLSGFVMVKCCRELTEDYKIKTHKRVNG